ncbi:MAG: hypothetical protein R2838_23435 [Caldilineaceae bacterium]
MTARWKKWGVHVTAETIGDRPAGEIVLSTIPWLAASAVLADAGLTTPPDLRISSTDANIPLSQGIPAVCAGDRWKAATRTGWRNDSPVRLGQARSICSTVATAAGWRVRWVKGPGWPCLHQSIDEATR